MPCARSRFRDPPGFRVGWYSPFRGKNKDMSIIVHCELKPLQPKVSKLSLASRLRTWTALTSFMIALPTAGAVRTTRCHRLTLLKRVNQISLDAEMPLRRTMNAVDSTSPMIEAHTMLPEVAPPFPPTEMQI